MKNRILRMGMISALLYVSALTVNAQAGGSFVITVPFDFSVSGKILPAGDYHFSRSTQTSDEGLRIRGRKHSAFIQTKTAKSLDIVSETQVVFMRYGNRFFLYQVWIAGSSTGREAFRSNEEQKAERDLARKAGKPETVSILVQPR